MCDCALGVSLRFAYFTDACAILSNALTTQIPLATDCPPHSNLSLSNLPAALSPPSQTSLSQTPPPHFRHPLESSKSPIRIFSEYSLIPVRIFCEYYLPHPLGKKSTCISSFLQVDPIRMKRMHIAPRTRTSTSTSGSRRKSKLLVYRRLQTTGQRIRS